MKLRVHSDIKLAFKWFLRCSSKVFTGLYIIINCVLKIFFKIIYICGFKSDKIINKFNLSPEHLVFR